MDTNQEIIVNNDVSKQPVESARVKLSSTFVVSSSSEDENDEIKTAKNPFFAPSKQSKNPFYVPDKPAKQ